MDLFWDGGQLVDRRAERLGFEMRISGVSAISLVTSHGPALLRGHALVC